MPQEGIGRLPAMRDICEEEWLRLRWAQDSLQRTLSLHGYRIVDTPAMQPTELFLRKSGGELASRLYSFVEPGGHKVSLRPEFTSAAIRLFVELGGREPLPVRWQYAGPVFRYEASSLSRPRQFTQLGAELIGAAGPRADAEVMAMAVRALRELGLPRVTLVIGDVGAIYGLVKQFGVSEHVALFLMGHIAQLKGGQAGLARTRGDAEGLGLFKRVVDVAEEGGGAGAQAPGGEALARRILEPSLRHPMGVRTPEEILTRVLQKLQAGDDSRRLERALGLLPRLVQIEGPPDQAVRAARGLIRSDGLRDNVLEPLEMSLEALALHTMTGVDVALDFGLARGIAYYTGLVFEVAAVGPEGRRHLGGGGRYDGLPKALGASEDVPAMGFALSMEEVLAALGDVGVSQAMPRRLRRVLVVAQGEDAYGPAIKVAEALRLGGEAAELLLTKMDASLQLQHACRSGVAALVMVRPDGSSERHWVGDGR